MWGHLPIPHSCVHLFIHPPACPPGRGGAFLWGHVPAFLSSGGLKAHAARFPFMYKGPLIQSDERRAAVGEGGDTDLGASCRTGWGPPGILPAGGSAQWGSGPRPGHRLCPPPNPWALSLKASPGKSVSAAPLVAHCPSLSTGPLWSNSSFPENASAAELGSPGASQGSRDWAL